MLFNYLLPLLCLCHFCLGQINRSPEFVSGGDMSNFMIREDTPVGSSVYTLRGRDPDGGKIMYYISGGTFKVNRDTGVVTLIKALDRESEPLLDVIITIIDEQLSNKPPNTVSHRREIKVIDFNDNVPMFIGTPYKFSLSESAKPFSMAYDGIFVKDLDSGLNSQITVECNYLVTPLSCDLFSVKILQVSEGQYKGTISLKSNYINFETNPNFIIAINATDRGGLSSTAEVIINVVDVQDEPPKFINAPYSISVNENTPPETSVLTIEARDGDATIANQRPLKMEIFSDPKSYFQLSQKSDHIWVLETSNVLIDREDPEILLNGSIYQILLKATEMINQNEYGDKTIASVSILIKDAPDQHPTFNLKSIDLKVSEDISNGSAIPGLNLIVSDSDIGDNSKFNLFIQNLSENNSATKIFSVFPTVAIGRTPVIIKVINSKLLDYDTEDKRSFLFNVVAVQNNIRSFARINLQLTDANDNVPIFENSQYNVKIPENTLSNIPVFTVKAIDLDSGEYGKIRYSLKGFGSEKFHINADTGQLSVAECDNTECIDFESQPTYSLTVIAADGGLKQSSSNLFIELIDVNDNAPIFTKNTYVSEIYETDNRISPAIIVKANDADGNNQGGGFGGIKYSILSTNLTGLAVDTLSGEIRLTKPIGNALQKLTSTQRKRLHFEATVRAVDNGKPSLSSTSKIIIYLKSERDGAPIFINEPYSANVKENAPPGTVVFQVKATDPDGPDSAITYSIIDGAKDNFVIDPKNGEIKVSLEADLDRDNSVSHYNLRIIAVDAAMPIPLSSNTNVSIYIEDVNNKPPKFESDTYVKYLPENQLTIGQEILRVSAIDSDVNAKVRYSILENNTIARDKTGLVIPMSAELFRHVFNIDPSTGVIKLNWNLDTLKASAISLTIEANDLNALDPENQHIRVEATIYIQSHDSNSPTFAQPWNPNNPNYKITVQEESLIGSTILTLAAHDPITNLPITKFEKIKSSDPDNYVSVSPVSGIVTLNKRLDFEELISKEINFSVIAMGSNDEISVANVLLQIVDVNDNSPLFSQDKYFTSVVESAKWPNTLLSVKANDKDSGDYGAIKYTASGDGSAFFDVDYETGTITLRKGAVLDREKTPFYHLQITATDGNGSVQISHKRQTSVLVTIKIIDTNDNAPKFETEKYKSIVSENAPIGFSIGSVKANDPDEGPNGKVKYELIDFGESNERFFAIDENTGIISVAKLLSGKGSTEPYEIHIKALDEGSPQQSSDTIYSILIGDISSNDGIPRFIKPTKDEIISINENSKPGTFVYQVEAIDADSRNTPNGKIVYKFLEMSPYFEIDPISGIIITTTKSGYQLDREVTSNVTLILVASDLGSPPQESHRVLLIKINDLDDNEPYFNRRIDAAPIIIEAKEELPIGSMIGSVTAVDKDTDKNAVIAYEIIHGNDNDSFSIETNTNGSVDNIGYIKNKKILDREKQSNFTLVIKAINAYKISEIGSTKHKPYMAEDFSQVMVTIKLININDNPLTFERENYITGVKLDVQLNTELIVFKANDKDHMENDQINYSIYNVTFVRETKVTTDLLRVFEIDTKSGSLRNAISLRPYIGGYFELIIQAKIINPFTQETNANDVTFVRSKLFVLHSKDLLKFIFHKKPNEVQNILKKFKNEFEHIFQEAMSPASLYLYDTVYHQRKDGSLDFESSSSCFQIVRLGEHIKDNKVVDSDDALKLIRSNSSIKVLFTRFGVTSVDNCTPLKPTYRISKSEYAIIAIAIIIAFLSVIFACIASNMKKHFKKKLIVSRIISTPVTPYGIPINTPSFMTLPEHQRIYEWQETNPQIDTVSFRSFPTLR